MREIVENLKMSKANSDGFPMEFINKFYMIGIDSDGFMTFMIQPVDNYTSSAALSSNGKYLKVDYYHVYETKSSNEVTIGRHIKLTLKSTEEFFENIFISICEELMDLIGQKPIYDDAINYVEGIIKLFSKAIKKRSITELGLWGELLLIDMCSNKNEVINSWHRDAKDTFDFNNGVEKIEVKTTVRNERIHKFSYNQLKKGADNDAVACSLVTSQIDKGLSVSDLYISIIEKIDRQTQSILNEKIIDICGDSLEGFTNKYDHIGAVNSIEFYHMKQIPNLEANHIPAELSNIKFDVFMEKTQCIDIIGEDWVILRDLNSVR